MNNNDNIKYDIDKGVNNFRIGGFATGHYYCQCVLCGKNFFGDKKTAVCLKCVIEDCEQLLEKRLREEKE